MIGNNGNKGNNKKDNMKNNIISKMESKVGLLFVEPVKKIKGDSTTTSSSISTIGSYPPMTITFISIKRSK